MSGDGDPRVRPWLPDTVGGYTDQGGPAEDLTSPSGAGPRNWWDDLPDPWDLPYQRSDPPTSELPPAAPGRRRAGWAARWSLRRAALLVIVVGAVLIGSGTVVRMLTAPQLQSLPPPTPPERVSDGSPTPDRTARLGHGPAGPVPRAKPAVPAVPTPTAAPPQGTTAPPLPTTAGPPAVSESYEAELAQLGGFARGYQEPAASGGQAVTAIGLWRLSYVEFGEVTVPAAGEYELSFHYLCSKDQRGEFRVDRGPYVALDFPSPANGAVGVVSVTVELVAGANRVWFGYSGSRGPDLDRITVTG